FGYEVMAFRYLLKPTLDKTFKDCMVAVKEKIHSQNEKVLIKADKGYVKILINDILYIESCNRKLMVYLINEKEPHIYYDKLDDVDVKLQNKGFLRVQKSYLINMEHTMKISNYVATLKNGVLVSTKKEGYAPMRDTFIQWKGAM
ncbi:MAG: LytTR family transcriptional regulator DNA-binding domain-containing protein, partial [Oscillospiraceae bacterium]